MTAQSRGSVRISGSGSAGGGRYDEVSISGSGAITADVEAARISASGSARMNGTVKAGVLRGSGSLKVEGSVDAGEFRCSGSTHVGGGVHAGLFRSSGSVRVGGNISGKAVEISGAGKVEGDVEVEEFRASGGLTIGGLLNADHVDLVVASHCQAKEIGGEQIRVMAPARTGRFLRWLRGDAALQVDTVEGDDIYLERTHAAAVRGRRVVIGSGCVIPQVAYSESLQIDPEAAVEHHTYTGQVSPAPEPAAEPAARPEGWARDHAGARCWFGIGCGQGQVHNPVLAVLGALLGLIIAAAVIALVIFVVLPAVGLVVTVVLGGVTLLLVVLLVGLPLLLLGSLLFGRSRRNHRAQ